MHLLERLLTLTRSFYPTGRAFRMPAFGYLESLHIALNMSEARAYNDAVSILSDILPDNDNFTEDDATDWERRLGLITNTSVSLSDRKKAIARKMNSPNRNPARQNYLYIEEQLQLAGFNVYVFENIFPDYPDGFITQTPEEVSGSPSIITPVQHGDFQHGDTQHGGFYNDKIVNYIDEVDDYPFDIGANYRCTFFIGGNPLGTFADVPATRHDEFRQLILTLKPVQTVGFLFINYV